jgi:drug/metabolite transporter (DMT)-like permease
MPALYLLLQVEGGEVDLIGVGQMLIASALYALHLPINQRVLYDMPAPTVTVFTLLAMSAVVVPTYLFSGAMTAQVIPSSGAITGLVSSAAEGMGKYGAPIIGLTLVTFLSRITLFLGVKHLGGMQTALLGLSELLVTLFFSHRMLGESFTSEQWLGALLLFASIALVGLEKDPPKKQTTGGFLSWLRPAGLPTDTWQPHD